MRILYLHQYFATPRGSAGTRSYEFSRRWAARGHSVTVVTTRAADASLPESRTAVTEDGVRLEMVDVDYSQGFGFIRRIAAFAAFALKSSAIVLFGPRYDVVVATSTPLTIAVPALVARWLRGMPVVFEVRDVWPDAAVDAGMLRSPLLIFLAKRLEAAAYRSSAAVVALSSGMADRIAGRVPSDTPVRVIPNASDIDAFAPSEARRTSAREALKVDGKFVVTYTGTLGTANDVPHLIELMKLTASNRQVLWMIAGAGNDSNLIRDGIERGEITNTRLLGSVPKTLVRELLAASDIGVISFIDTPTYFDNSPNKFFDYCAAGLPVLFTRSTWASTVIEQYGAGWVDATHSPAEAARIILRASSEPTLRAKAASGARRLAEQEFERGALSMRYLDLIESVFAQSRVQ